MLVLICTKKTYSLNLLESSSEFIEKRPDFISADDFDQKSFFFEISFSSHLATYRNCTTSLSQEDVQMLYRM